ncbi:hypothetical protein HDU91_004245 [Kappamyces sp. JEL0680]|nr:hypothetical protein HDU91_004245 [Kappamyces sp. JEL0680]
MFWALVSLFRGGYNDRKPVGKTHANGNPYQRRVSFERRSVAAFSVNSANTARIKRRNWVDPDFVPTVDVLVKIMSFLSPGDAVKLIRLCQLWSGPAAEAFYQTPPIQEADAFPKLTALLLSANTTHPYALLIREFVFKGMGLSLMSLGTAADELLMGDLKSALSVCPNLVSFRIEGCTHLSNLLAQFLKEHAPFLSRIELPGCAVSDSFLIQLIRGVRSLRHIDVSYSNVTLSTLPLLVRECQYLETLDMTACQPCPDEMVIDYEASEYYLVGDLLKQYKNSSLRQVAVSNTQITDSMVGYICRHCDNLDSILLDGCSLLTDNSVNSIAMHCPGIKMLNLSCCDITDVALQSLAVHLSVQNTKLPKPRPASYSTFSEYQQPTSRGKKNDIPLSIIILSGCANITQAGVTLLASKCPNLHTIVLDGCDRYCGWSHGRVTDWYFNKTEAPKSAVLALLEGVKEESGDSDTESFVSAKSDLDGSAGVSRNNSPIPRPLSVNRKQLLDRKKEQ